MTLALVLAMLLTVSATVFAVDTWTHGWTASDGTSVEYYATINTARTYGDILSGSNQGEVTADLVYCYNDGSGSLLYDYFSCTDIDYAYVSSRDDVSGLRAAHYSFSAYVPTENDDEYFDSGIIDLYP